MHSDAQRPAQLTLFLLAFFAVWTVRATALSWVDETIASPTLRAAYSDLLKMWLWALPAGVFVVALRRTGPAKYLGMTVWPDARAWASCLAVTAIYLEIVALVGSAVQKKAFSPEAVTSLSVPLFALRLLLSPLLEELLFRGFILKELLALLPKARAIVLTSLLFAASHLPYWLSHRGLTQAVASDAIGVFIFSLVASWLFARTQSIWPPTLAHVAANVLASVLTAGIG